MNRDIALNNEEKQYCTLYMDTLIKNNKKIFYDYDSCMKSGVKFIESAYKLLKLINSQDNHIDLSTKEAVNLTKSMMEKFTPLDLRCSLELKNWEVNRTYIRFNVKLSLYDVYTTITINKM